MIEFLRSQDIYHLLGFFIIYSFAGWVWESGYCSLKERKLINRGFLTGPFLPLYGCGAVSVYLLLYPYRDQWIAVYAGGALTATLLEYVTSWLMERFFDANWWDYSREKFNIHGRICLRASLLWGVFSLALIRVVHPAVAVFLDSLPEGPVRVAETVFVIVFAADLAATVAASIDIKKALQKMEGIRLELASYLEGHPLAGQFQNVMVPDILKSLKEQWDDLKKYLPSVPSKGVISEYRQELENKVAELLRSYEKLARIHQRITKRYFKAYPHFRSRRHSRSLQDLKDYIEDRRKEK